MNNIQLRNACAATGMSRGYFSAMRKAGEIDLQPDQDLTEDQLAKIASDIHILEFFKHIPDTVKELEMLARTHKDEALQKLRPASMRQYPLTSEEQRRILDSQKMK